MTYLSTCRTVNLQFFVINSLPISVNSYIFEAKKSIAALKKDLQNQQSTSFASNNASEKTDGKAAKSSRNRFITVNENDFINRQGFSSLFILKNTPIGNNRLWRCR